MARTTADESTSASGSAGHLALGRWGERVAERYYRRDGYRVLARNWRCGSGEIDLILERSGTVVFCEVKTRTSEAFGHPAEAVDQRRQGRLRQAAVEWIKADGRSGSIRFDVVAVLPGRVERLEGAF
ncbi:MAG: YraN family protein [Acidimicrobiia bacterium]|nr:YraN family protein [Actinomycetota bacterium]MBL6923878.1 YraN family protein [Acidimicrobiia bacterium]MBL6926369.1 YraN family protein [Acidimicrobiia bacterium]